MVLDFVSSEIVAVADGRGEGAAHFRFTADGDAAWLIRRRRGDVSHLARRVFIVSGVVFVGGLHGDFVSGVVFTERIGAAVGFVDGLPIAQPLVLHVSGVEFIGISHGRGQFTAHFRFTADGNGTRLIGGLCCDTKAVAVVGFIMQTVIAVFDMDADFFACVFRAQGVGFLCRPLHSHAVNQPLVADAAVGHGIGIAHVRGKGTAHFGIAANGDAAFTIGIVRIIIHAQSEGFFDAKAALISRSDGQRDFCFRRIVNMHTVFEFEDAVSRDFEALITQCITVAVLRIRINSLHHTDGHAVFTLFNVVLLLTIDQRQSLIQLNVCRGMIFR